MPLAHGVSENPAPPAPFSHATARPAVKAAPNAGSFPITADAMGTVPCRGFYLSVF